MKYKHLSYFGKLATAYELIQEAMAEPEFEGTTDFEKRQLDNAGMQIFLAITELKNRQERLRNENKKPN